MPIKINECDARASITMWRLDLTRGRLYPPCTGGEFSADCRLPTPATYTFGQKWGHIPAGNPHRDSHAFVKVDNSSSLYVPVHGPARSGGTPVELNSLPLLESR